MEINPQQKHRTDTSIKQADSQIHSEMGFFRLPKVIIEHLKPQAKSQKYSKPQTIKKQKYENIIKRSLKRLTNRQKKVQVLLNCPICQQQYQQIQMIKIGQKCNHYFCKNCLISYVCYKINIFQEVYCLNQDCYEVMSKNCIIYKQLNSIMQQRYDKIHQFQIIKSSNNLHLCPNENCKGILQIENQNKKVQCQQCNRQFCSLCFMKSHSGQCDQYQISFFEAKLNYKQCRKCKRVIERIAGCNHMNCACGFQFCYNCGKKWDIDHLCNTTPQCCIQHPFLRMLIKIFYILLYGVIYYPILAMKSLFIIVALITIILTIGVLLEPFLILSELYDFGWKQFLLGIIFFPLLPLWGIYRAIQQFSKDFCEQAFSFDQYCSFCTMINQLLGINEDQ